MATLTSFPIIQRQTPRPPAGWYPDPLYPDPIGSANWLRYWDGSAWTAETALTVRDGAPSPEPVPAEAATPGVDAEAAEGAAPSDEAPADADEDQAPAESAANYDSSWSGPSALPRSGSKSAPSSWGSGWALVMGALVLIAIFAAARPGHHMTTRASAKALTPLPQRTLVPVGVGITSPVDGNTVHAHSVVIKGVVARGDARVMVNGDSAVLVGHRFAMRVPLHLGYNEFDVSAEEPGFGAGLTSVSIVRTRSTSERAALRARRIARRVAAARRQASIPAGQRAGAQGPAQTTYTGVSGSTNGNTVDVAATDADLVQRPPSSKAPSASTPTPTPTPSPSTPAPLPADPTPTP